MSINETINILGGEKALNQKVKSRMDLIALSQKGVPKTSLTNLAKYLSLSISQISKLLPISERTIQRYTPNKLFDHLVSEQIIAITEVVVKGVAVFEDKDRFLAWMNHPTVALGNKKPIDLLNSRFGLDMVLDELVRIEHGVYY